VARKLKNRSSSTLMDTFLKLDLDRDGYVTRSDLKKSLHNILGIDLTKEQMNAIFARFSYFDESMIDDDNPLLSPQKAAGKHHGIRYADFVKYIHDTALDMPVASDDYGSSLQLQASNDPHIASFVPPKDAVTYDLRRALNRKLMEHVSKRGGGGNGVDAQLFLSMDTNRSGKVSPEEFQKWLAGVGMDLTEQQCKIILGKHYHPAGIDLREFVQMIDSISESSHAEVKPMSWESIDKQHIRGRKLVKKKNGEDNNAEAALSTQLLADAVKLCADDSESDQTLIQSIAQRIFSKRYTMLKAFDKLDRDQDGTLSPEELRNALSKGGLEVSDERARSLVSKFGRDNNGKLNMSDFVVMLSSNNAVSAADRASSAQSSKAADSASIKLKRLSLLDDKEGHEDEARQTEIAFRLDLDDIDAVLEFRRAIKSEVVLVSRCFQQLDKDKSRTLSHEELKAGFEKLGIKVTSEQVLHIISRFDGGGTGRLNYVQFIQLLSASLEV
jgi:Ca2+-binding EF-hand superfamily protein